MSVPNINFLNNSQPLRQVAPAVPLRNSSASFKNLQAFGEPAQTNDIPQEKYEFACRLAAYYKLQYEKLATKQPCYV